MIGEKIMKILIKRIRELVGMSQEQFAKELSTTVVSINRWENGKTVPNLMAQNQLFEFCKKHNIDISDAIIDKYKYYNESKFILYHGSKNGIIGDIAPISRGDCDFGTGFYMGTEVLQPLTLICGEEKPVFYAVDFSLKDLNVLNIELGLEWAMVIAYHRGYMDIIKGTKMYEKYAHYLDGYDVVVGYIADDRLYTELNKFFNGNITDEVLMRCLSALDLGKQYVALTEKACKNVTVLKDDKLSNLELSVLMEKSIIRRLEGNSLSKGIEIKYRRIGKYFDEILRGE
ncbi:MAG: DUF3990 domain-containing protein [Erysipelotrichaceae bacterium]|nr:DUF3990 domain-containing protein [Erysipelotrichaceae bacterium]